MPRYDGTSGVVELEKTHGLNLVSPMMTPEQATHDLGVVLSYLHQGLVLPETQETLSPWTLLASTPAEPANSLLVAPPGWRRPRFNTDKL